jgi:hypothetical protein
MDSGTQAIRVTGISSQEVNRMGRSFFRHLSLIAVAIFLVQAVPAAAVEKTKILPEPTVKEPVSGFGSSGEVSFETASGTRLKCEKATATGKFTTPNSGTGEAHVVGCESLGFKCNSPGAKSGEVILKDEALYWKGLSAAKTLIAVAVALITGTFEIECTALVKLKKRGCTAGQVPAEELNKKIKVLTGTLKQSKGKQEITEIMKPEGTEFIKCQSELSINGGAFELIGQEGSGTLTVEKEIELMN